ncbi:MAG: hypothetical protein GF416_03430 [Candidatus Altiarchaeales archaeon]|nr:hypothetical protein [Candidatus Altiarchaeales archaeon]MBD3416171.1 hypothetical protein [Candidatus Altiarchaeales archaeon]
MPKPRSGIMECRLARLFIISLAASLLLDMSFFLVHGSHAVNHAELWTYVGVAEGNLTTAVGSSDPTVWLLRAVGFLLDGDALFYSMVVLSAALTSLTAVLVCLLVSRLADDRAGAYAGYIYAFMVQPLSLTAVGFTHDHILTPLSLAALVLAVEAVKNAERRRKMAFTASAVVLFYLGSRVNIGAYVAVAVAVVYALSQAVVKRKDIIPLYAIALLTSIYLFGTCVVPGFMDYELGRLPQGRLGSADINPVTVGNLALRYNLLLLVLPFGAYAAYRRREFVSLTYVLFGFMLAMSMDRGTRVVDLGMAMVTAYFLRDWKPRWRMGFTLYSIPALASATLLTPLQMPYRVILAASGLGFIFLHRYRKVNTLMMLSLICLTGFSLSFTNMAFENQHVISESEYIAYSRMASLPGKKVLASWDAGYMLEYLSGKKSASTPGLIRYDLHEALWMGEKQANAYLSASGVDYVVVSNAHYNIVQVDGAPNFLLRGGLVFRPLDPVTVEFAPYLAIHKLRYGTADPEYFRFLGESVDERRSEKHMVYEVVDPDTSGSYISFIAYNNGEENRTSLVNVSVWEYTGRKAGKKRKSIMELANPLPYIECLRGKSLRVLALYLLLLFAYPFNGRKAGFERYIVRNRRLIAVVLLAVLLMVYLIPGDGATGEVPMPGQEAEPPEYAHKTFEVFFEAGALAEHSLDVGDLGRVRDCEVGVVGGQNGVVGHTTFRNICPSFDDVLKVLLVDANSTELYGEVAVVDSMELRLTMGEGEEKRVDYVLERATPNHDYKIGYWKSSCLQVVPEKTEGPDMEGIEIFHVSCGRYREDLG